MQTLFEHPLFLPLAMMAVILAVLPLAVAYTVLLERKVLADMQVRLGPMRVGPHGLLQTIADAVKLLSKEDTIPAEANKWIFRFAPVISFFTAAVCFSVIPLSKTLVITDVNVGLLVIAAMSAVGILGIILGGWSSNSHYSLLGGLRAAAQLVSYEVALSLALVSGVMAAGTLSLKQIVLLQQERGLWFAFDNYGLMFIPFLIYFISSVAETNRAPFDLPEAESELVAGFHTEYSGFRWAIYYLAEYTNMFVVGAVAISLFWGGWLRPFPSIGWLEYPLNYGVPAAIFLFAGVLCFPLAGRLDRSNRAQALSLRAVGVLLVLVAILFLLPQVNALAAAPFWFFFKLALVLYVLIWLRGTFPRYRYDQLMNIGWKVMIPLGLVMLLVNAVVGIARA
jgi:NADH-quinone oxidoreductase subunit H